jgi:hypothetical protein
MHEQVNKETHGRSHLPECVSQVAPKGPWAEACSQGWCCGEMLGVFSHWGHTLSLPLSVVSQPWGEPLRSTHAPTVMCCLHHRPKSNGPTNHGLKPPKPWAKISCPLYKLVYSRSVLQWLKANMLPNSILRGIGIIKPDFQLHLKRLLGKLSRHQECRTTNLSCF